MKSKVIIGIVLALLFIGMLTFVFNIQLVEASGTIHVRANGSIDPPTAPISSVDNITYTFTDNIYDSIVVERNNIAVDGAGYTLQGTENGTGIDLSYRSNITIKNMRIKAFYYGIYLYLSSSNTISGNNIKNTYNGVDLLYSSNNSIYGNTITDNGHGIGLEYSSNNSISANSITANHIGGIRLYESSNNVIYHNNFEEKIGQHASTYGGYGNLWDNGYPSGGNYWSDYTGVDVKSGPNQNRPGSDGIRDHPYVIDENNKDNYPLMKPYGCAHDIGIANVTTSETAVAQGYNLSINIRIVNYGVNDETFNAIVYLDDLALPSPDQANTFWDMGDVNRDGYIDLIDLNLVTAALGSKSSDPDWSPDFDLNGDLEVNILDVITVGINFTSDVWTYFELSPAPIGKQTVTLTGGNSTTVTFIWKATDVPYDKYTITANATIVPGETDTTDNTYISGIVTIKKRPEYILTIHSSPIGVTFAVDAVSCKTPWSGTYSEGTSASLVMPETHDGYVWSHWLEDGDTNRIKTVTIDANITLTGVFTHTRASIWFQWWFWAMIMLVATTSGFSYLVFRYRRREGIFEQLQRLVRPYVRNAITEEDFEEKLRKLEERSDPDRRARIKEYLPPIKTLELALKLIDEGKKEKK